MTTISATDAKENLAQLILQTERGDEVVIIMLKGSPLARIAPIVGTHDPEEARAAIRRLREYAKANPIPNLTIDEIKSWIVEGRP